MNAIKVIELAEKHCDVCGKPTAAENAASGAGLDYFICNRCFRHLIRIDNKLYQWDSYCVILDPDIKEEFVKDCAIEIAKVSLRYLKSNCSVNESGEYMDKYFQYERRFSDTSEDEDDSEWICEVPTIKPVGRK